MIDDIAVEATDDIEDFGLSDEALDRAVALDRAGEGRACYSLCY